MDSLRKLFWLHYATSGPRIALWDEWLPNATLWPARGEGAQLDAMRQRWARALTGRVMDADGYIETQQHDGPAHAGGWPFPTWMQAGGIGWQFRPLGVPAAYEPPLTTPEKWKLRGGERGRQRTRMADRIEGPRRNGRDTRVCRRSAYRAVAAA